MIRTNGFFGEQSCISERNEPHRDEPSTLKRTSNEKGDDGDSNSNDDIEVEGRIYEKHRDPPGQKCVYILPGDTEKEVYRLSTFFKFPAEEVPVDPCFLAKYGFYYTGYKDRVKCFSCGMNVMEWKELDNPKDRKWHFKDCPLVLGAETRNMPILQKPIIFEGNVDSSGDSGYGASESSSDNAANGACSSASCSTSSTVKQFATMNSREIKADNTGINQSAAAQESEKFLSEGISVMQIGNDNVVVSGNNNVVTIQNDRSSVPTARQTAQVRKPTVGAEAVQGLSLATIISSYHQELLTKVLNLHREEDRKKSFFGWALIFTTVTPDSLAKSGFFYLGNSDRVQCFSCSGVLRNWKENDNVDQQHSAHFPSCKMVMATESRNISLPNTSVNVFPMIKVVEPPDPSPEEIANLKRQFPCLYPVNPHMRSFDERFQTFDHRWPKHKINASIRHIVKAGFYFLGDRDRAKCWYCNGGLQNWEANDEPFTEHAKWFPGCEYILQTKGIEFVKRIVTKFPSLKRPTLSNPRFDHRTMKLISVNPSSNQQQPVVIDPRENLSAGEVLSSSSPPTIQNSSGNTDSEGFENMAVAMGFDRALAQRLIQRRIQSEGRNFDNIQDLLDILLIEASILSVDVLPPQEATERVGPIHEPPPIIEVCETASLKRNSNATEPTCSNDELIEGEAPAKKSKTGLNEELANLENNRKCKMCRKATANRVVLPCGHLSLCSDCEKKAKACPLCKHKIQALIKAYVV